MREVHFISRRAFLESAATLATSALLLPRALAQGSADGLGHLFPGFEERWIELGPVRLFARIGGPEGAPAMLMLHGYPQSHLCWHSVAPTIAKTRRVVCLDLKGYGLSSAPPGGGRHEAYSKRTWAKEAIAAMASLGISRFAVAGHDRGAQVGYRMALDTPEHVEKLVVLDNLPIFAVWDLIEATPGYLPWWTMMARPFPEPERILTADYIEGLVKAASWNETLDVHVPEVLASYRRNWADPARVHAYCEDYRAGAGIDLEHDREDLAAKKSIQAPVMILWSKKVFGNSTETPLATWDRSFAPGCTGQQFECGHFLMEEKPAETIAALQAFLA